MKSKPKSQIAVKIGENIFYYRDRGKITQGKLAEIIKMTPNYIALLERGEKGASVEVLVAIAKALDCKASDLLKGL